MKRTSSAVPSKLSDSIRRPLKLYALAASAAGVVALVMTQAAEAKIVYTPAHRVIGPNQIVPLDLNSDGKADFTFSNYTDTFEGSAQGFLFVQPAQSGNEAEGNITYGRAIDLPAGRQVGAKRHFVSTKDIFMISANASHRCFGYWDNVKNRYLGLKFVINHKTHFGWARLSASCDSTTNKIKALLTGYAYETIANKPIVTGKKMESNSAAVRQAPSITVRHAEAASLGVLALGAQSISVWRREEPAPEGK